MHPALILAALLLAGTSAQAQPGLSDLRFAIMRNGEQIGTYALELDQAGAETTVNLATNVVVKKLFITFYRYEHTSTEHWANGRLVALSSATDDNGTKHKVDVASKGAGLQVLVDGKSVQIDKTTIPASLWNPVIVRQSVALNTVEGKLMPITVTDDGIEDVTAQGHLIKAHHYTINGPFKQDVWYDEQGRLVHAQFVGTDGSIITYELTSSRLEASRVGAPPPQGKPR
jgi:Family of unknown function (DUF6134)